MDLDNLRKEIKVPDRVIKSKDPKKKLNITQNIRIEQGVLLIDSQGLLKESSEPNTKTKILSEIFKQGSIVNKTRLTKHQYEVLNATQSRQKNAASMSLKTHDSAIEAKQAEILQQDSLI